MLQAIGSFKFVSHKATTSWEFDWSKDLYPTKLEQRPRVLIKLSLESCVIPVTWLIYFKTKFTIVSLIISTGTPVEENHIEWIHTFMCVKKQKFTINVAI